MKGYLLAFLISAVAFVIATFFLPGLSYRGMTDTLVKAAITFALLNTFVRPLLKIVLMPLNFLTLGLFGGLMGLIILWLVTVLVPGFVITASHFTGGNLGGLSIPPYDINAILTVIFGAILIGFITSALYWITK